MSWIQMAVAIPTALLVVALVHDFLAGLGEERLWSDPVVNDSQSFSYRETAAELTHRRENVKFPEEPGYAPSWDKLLTAIPQA